MSRLLPKMFKANCPLQFASLLYYFSPFMYSRCYIDTLDGKILILRKRLKLNGLSVESILLVRDKRHINHEIYSYWYLKRPVHCNQCSSNICSYFTALICTEMRHCASKNSYSICLFLFSGTSLHYALLFSLPAIKA